jgi:hypothetical protein
MAGFKLKFLNPEIANKVEFQIKERFGLSAISLARTGKSIDQKRRFLKRGRANF